MRRSSLLVFCVVALVAGMTPAAALAPLDLDGASPVEVASPGGFSSDNVEYVATIPFDSPGVSAKVRHFDDAEHGYDRLLYVSGVKGVTIYDLADPALPLPVGHLTLPHSQNEDVQVSEDGTRMIVSADGNLPAPNPATRGLHIIDTSDPTSPQRVAWLDHDGGGTNHTSACADASCDWIYGSTGGIYEVVDAGGETIVDKKDRNWFFHHVDDLIAAQIGDQIEDAPQDDEGRTRLTPRSHALNRSVHPDPESGEPVDILISDTRPRLMMDVSDPADPVVLTTSADTDFSDDGFIQHNNLRPNAHFWTPRSADDEAGADGGPQLPPQASDRARQAVGQAHGTDDPSSANGVEPFDAPGNASGQRAATLPDDAPDDGVSGGDLRPGELVIGNSESNLVPQCGPDAGGLTTFSIADFDEGAPIERLHTFGPENGDYVSEGNPAVNGLGCSGHWFDIQDGDNIIAASWYEHGIKLIEIQEDYSMEQIGFFQPVATEAGAAYWVTDDDGTEYVYSTDYARGIDIIRFDRDPDLRPSEDEVRASWAAGFVKVAPYSDQARQWCRLGDG
jgi:hypothetical protein